jgi:succinate-semialdehyde dehydrogenase/glutarate-semialdehyde dehydrogenase
LSADILDYYADNGEVFLADKVLDPEHGETIIQNSPIGFMGVMGISYQVANIMVGNTILLKHASTFHNVLPSKNSSKKTAPEGLYTNLFISGKHASADSDNEKHNKGH